MIYLKLILAFLLSAMPFLYVSYVKPKRKTSPKWRNMFTAIASQMPRLYAIRKACSNFIHRLYAGMKFSDNFRKFFMLMTTILMIVVQFVDLSATTEIAKEIIDATDNATEGTPQTADVIAAYATLMTKPHATLLAAAFSLMIFAFKSGDWLLTKLHNSQKLFFFVAIADVTLLFFSQRFLIVVEIVEIILMAALIYPNKVIFDPKQRKNIPEEQQILQFIKNAA